MLQSPSLPASVLKLQYKSYINKEHPSRKKKGTLEGRGGKNEKKEEQRGGQMQKRKKRLLVFSNLILILHRNTKTYLILMFLMRKWRVSPFSPCEPPVAIKQDNQDEQLNYLSHSCYQLLRERKQKVLNCWTSEHPHQKALTFNQLNASRIELG